MAREIVVNLVDDIDGSKAASTVRFALDSVDYEIDLSSKNESAMRKDLARYLEAARRVRADASGRSAGRRAVSAKPEKERNPAIRSWASSHGVPVADRGRIPGGIAQAFDAQDTAALFAAVGMEAPKKSRRVAEPKFASGG